jgi:hypothetical protein
LAGLDRKERVTYSRRFVACLILSGCLGPLIAPAQIDPVKRQLIQLGYNQSLEGHAPLSAYAFYYLNQPQFLRTNLTLRLAVAPVYLDSELGIHHALGENTDVGIGLAGGGFADSHAEIREGRFLRRESFTGHGGETSVSLYHAFTPASTIPLNGILRGTFHYSTYERDSRTASDFNIPDDHFVGIVRTGLRWGGREPTLYPSLAMELSAWYEGQFRSEAQTYGFAGDRRVEAQSHLFWAQALLAYTLQSQQSFYVNLSAGTSVKADRFSAYRLGSLLPMASEFPLSLPGYYFQEFSAESFVLLGGNYSVPLDSKNRWNLNFTAATAAVDYLEGMEQPGHWHSGVGGGLLYKSTDGGWNVMLGYAYGIDAIRAHGRGAHTIGVLVQLDLEQTRERLLIFDPARWRGLQRIFSEFGY